jgi:hypothetical protein
VAHQLPFVQILYVGLDLYIMLLTAKLTYLIEYA